MGLESYEVDIVQIVVIEADTKLEERVKTIVRQLHPSKNGPFFETSLTLRLLYGVLDKLSNNRTEEVELAKSLQK